MKSRPNIKIGIAVVTILLLLFVQCKPIKKSSDTPPMPFDMNDDQKCYHNGNLTQSERLQIYPFNKAETVKVISFNSRLGKTPITKDTLIASKIIESVTLSAGQIDSLTDILYNYNYSKTTNTFSESTVGCYFPRHSIVFLNKSKKVIAFIEICLECKKIVTALPSESVGNLCDGKYELIHNFFLSTGLKHYTD